MNKTSATSLNSLSPFFRQRKTFSEWYEEKEAERKMQAEMNDDWIFRPGGKKRQDYEKERQQSRTYRSREVRLLGVILEMP